MRSQRFITDHLSGGSQRHRQLIDRYEKRLIGSFLFLYLLVLSSSAQRLAILTPENTDRDILYAEELTKRFPRSVKIFDHSLSDAAFRSVALDTPFNMTTSQARAVADVIGCDHFLLVRTGAQRRASLSRPEYYEAFAVLYLVNGRTGELILWRIKSFDGDDQTKADEGLAGSLDSTITELMNRLTDIRRQQSGARSTVPMEELPSEGSPASVGLAPPIPYKRIKPEYTPKAFSYEIRGTVEIEVDIAADGNVLSTRIVRWTGFDLEESVEKAVRTMNWRPAMRSGKPLPMRVLLRYNFTKMDRE